VLPLVFSLLGLGGASFTATLVQYRHIFLALTFVLLGVSFYLNYIKVHSHIASRVIFWISAVIALGFVGYAYL